MATGTKKLTASQIDEGVRGFSMAIREAVMEYYKGTCIQGFNRLSNYNVGTSRIPLENDGTRRNFNYEREDHQRRNPIAYYLDNAKMFELWRDGHEVIFQPSVMRRSPEMSAAYDQIRAFFDKYLASVTIIERDEKNVAKFVNGSNDNRYIYRDLEKQIANRDQEDADEYYDEDF